MKSDLMVTSIDKSRPALARCRAVHNREIQFEVRGVPGFLLGVLEPQSDEVAVGDVLRVDWKPDGSVAKISLATRNVRGDRTTSFWDHFARSERVRGVAARKVVEREIRKYFLTKGYQEIETPLLVPSPGMETHIRPVQAVASGEGTSPAYLPTSPEFALKRVLAAGYDRVFQIAPCFRVEGRSKNHLSQFRMLEWYTAFQSYDGLMDQTEDLVMAIAAWFPEAQPKFQAPWRRYSIRDLFRRTFSRDLRDCALADLRGIHFEQQLDWLESDSWDDLFHRLWLNRVEPTFPRAAPFFVYGFPASQAALSKLETLSDGWVQARRFEVYFGDLELANAFEELTDPVEQRARFVRDMESRQKIYGKAFPATPLDEGFLRALEEGIPPCSGIALGVDRLIQILAGVEKIQDTVWLEPVLIDDLPVSL